MGGPPCGRAADFHSATAHRRRDRDPGRKRRPTFVPLIKFHCRSRECPATSSNPRSLFKLLLPSGRKQPSLTQRSLPSARSKATTASVRDCSMPWGAGDGDVQHIALGVDGRRGVRHRRTAEGPNSWTPGAGFHGSAFAVLRERYSSSIRFCRLRCPAPPRCRRERYSRRTRGSMSRRPPPPRRRSLYKVGAPRMRAEGWEST